MFQVKKKYLFDDMATTGTFQPYLDSIKDYLDWNRWMLIGITLWGLLVAIVVGSSSNTALPVPCAGAGVTALSLECTCNNHFPGIIWIAGWILGGGIVIIEFVTDILARNDTQVRGPKGWVTSTADKKLEGVEALIRNLARDEVLKIYIFSIPSMVNSVAQLNISEDLLQDIAVNIRTIVYDPGHSPTTLTSQAVTKLQSETNKALWNYSIQLVVQTAVAEICYYYNTQIRIQLRARDRGFDVYKAVVGVVSEDKVLPRVKDTLQLAITKKITENSLNLTSQGGWLVFAFIFRLISNAFIFYIIIMLTSYNWFPQPDKGCFVSTISRGVLLGTGLGVIVVTGLRILFCDLVDPLKTPAPT